MVDMRIAFAPKRRPGEDNSYVEVRADQIGEVMAEIRDLLNSKGFAMTYADFGQRQQFFGETVLDGVNTGPAGRKIYNFT